MKTNLDLLKEQKMREVINLLDEFHQRYDVLSKNLIRLYAEDGSYTGVEVADDGVGIVFEGRVIGGIDELIKRL